MIFRPAVIAALLATTTACASVPPAWTRDCRTEAVATRLAVTPPAGLALSQRGELWALPNDRMVFELLTGHRAEWVEIVVWPAIWTNLEHRRSIGAFPSTFTEGAGLYALTLGDLMQPACADALYRNRLTPDGRARLERPQDQRDTTELPPSLYVCMDARRTADGPELGGELARYDGPIAWTAPFGLDMKVRNDSGAEPRFYRTRMRLAVVNRESGQAVWQATQFVIADRKPIWFPGLMVCGPDRLPAIFGTDDALVPGRLLTVEPGGPSGL